VVDIVKAKNCTAKRDNPDTWVDFAQLPDDTAFIVKGSSADKGAWERMYAPTKSAAIQLRSLLQRDTGMRAQTLVARRYVPLERLGDGLGGCPVSTEFRVFVLDREVVGRGFYWPPEDCTEHGPPLTVRQTEQGEHRGFRQPHPCGVDVRLDPLTPLDGRRLGGGVVGRLAAKVRFAHLVTSQVAPSVTRWAEWRNGSRGQLAIWGRRWSRTRGICRGRSW
jgi:hypothetical protein